MENIFNFKNKNKVKFLYIMGMSGSGKTTLAKTLDNDSARFNRLVQYTSRPQRENEVDGLDYFFVSKKSFEKLDSEGMFFGCVRREFPGNYYGTPISSIDEDRTNIVVVSIEGLIDSLKKFGSKNSMVLMIDDVIPEAERENRDASAEEKYNNIILDYIQHKEPKLNIVRIPHHVIKTVRNDINGIIDVIEDELGFDIFTR